MSRIETLEAFVLSVQPEEDAFAPGAREEMLLVRVTDSDGLYGIGECMAAPRVNKAMVDMPTVHAWSQGIRDILIGADPLERVALYDRIYHGSFYHGRRGILVQALSAVDIAIHDLAAKQIGKPVYKLLGGARTDKIVPYATLYPGDIFGQPVASVLKAFEARIKTVMDYGLRAMKVPLLFGPAMKDRELIPFIRDCRQLAGDDVLLAVDFGYRWRDWHDAAWLLKRIENYDIYFAEAPLWHDNLHGYAKLVAVSPIRIAGAECATSRWEIKEWLEVGNVSVVQPSISHCGGFVELMRIAEMCELQGATLIPHSYATGITDTCNFHLQAATLNVPVVEFRSPRLSRSRLRTALVDPAEPQIVDGVAVLPDKPGLGIELNEEMLKETATDLGRMRLK